MKKGWGAIGRHWLRVGSGGLRVVSVLQDGEGGRDAGSVRM